MCAADAHRSNDVLQPFTVNGDVVDVHPNVEPFSEFHRPIQNVISCYFLPVLAWGGGGGADVFVCVTWSPSAAALG